MVFVGVNLFFPRNENEINGLRMVRRSAITIAPLDSLSILSYYCIGALCTPAVLSHLKLSEGVLRTNTSLNTLTKEGGMKYLIASVGSRLDSFVAKRFEHAAWYLIVDDETLAVDATHNILPHDHNAILARAVLEKVETVVAGKFSAGSLRFIRSHELMTAHVHGISATQAIEKVQRGELRTESELDLMGGSATPADTLPREVKSKIRKSSFESNQFSSDSPRGRHHVQQYGGRGH